MKQIKLDLICVDDEMQSREVINKATVGDYADAMTEGAKLPPVVLFFDGAVYWLADGFHRHHAHRKIGALSIDADVREGTRRDAVLYSVGANATHGLRRTNNDKRRAVMTLLNDVEWNAWSDSAIAKACGVSVSFVGDVRRSIISPTKDGSSAAQRTVERNGKRYMQDTTNIGRSKGRDDAHQMPMQQEHDEAITKPADNIDFAPINVATNAETVRAQNGVSMLGSATAEPKIEIPESPNDCQHTADNKEMVCEATEVNLLLAAAMARIKQLEEIVCERETRILSLEGEKGEAIRLYEAAKDALEQLQQERGLHTA